MNKYLITSYHDVNVDSYENGEGDFVNGYTLSEIIKYNSPFNAIEKYFESVLGYEYDVDNTLVDEDGLHYDVLVDSENAEVDRTSNKYKEWKEGRTTLWNNHILIKVEQIVSIDLEDEIMFNS